MERVIHVCLLGEELDGKSFPSYTCMICVWVLAQQRSYAYGTVLYAYGPACVAISYFRDFFPDFEFNVNSNDSKR